MSLDDDARTELRELDAAGRRRSPRTIEASRGMEVVVDGATLLNFASNDYLGLAGDPRLARAAADACEDSGVGAAASRLITGSHRHHVALEAALGDWLRRPARLFNSGYAANTGVVAAVAGPRDVIFSDELNHASLIDGCRLSRARIVVYPHGDIGALEAAVRAHPSARRRLVVTESLFSMDGDIADLAAIEKVCGVHDAALIVDEAHAIGARGPEGRGVAAELGIESDVVIGTCGKALGTFGAFASSSDAIVELLQNRARSYVFSTAMPPAVAAASAAAIALVRGTEGDQLRRKLATNARSLREELPSLGGEPDGSIAPLIIGADQRTMEISARLFSRGVFVQGIRPPTVPDGTARLRLGISAAHTKQQLATVASTLREIVR